ncbi:unnamed protein product [Lasius platythorax]|uniref:Uncharacterized protein n=1 Tax=Lasius platythorax TaxID=488582 RepID=A0AAV2P150_9HYME
MRHYLSYTSEEGCRPINFDLRRSYYPEKSGVIKRNREPDKRKKREIGGGDKPATESLLPVSFYDLEVNLHARRKLRNVDESGIAYTVE